MYAVKPYYDELTFIHTDKMYKKAPYYDMDPSAVPVSSADDKLTQFNKKLDLLIEGFNANLTLSSGSGNGSSSFSYHCTSQSPPMSCLMLCESLLAAGNKINVDFFKHSSSLEESKYTKNLKQVFDEYLSSSASLRLSIIWKECQGDSRVFLNPFQDGEMFGELIALVLIYERFFGKVEESLKSLLLSIEQEVSLKASAEKVPTFVKEINKLGSINEKILANLFLASMCHKANLMGKMPKVPELAGLKTFKMIAK